MAKAKNGKAKAKMISRIDNPEEQRLILDRAIFATEAEAVGELGSISIPSITRQIHLEGMRKSIRGLLGEDYSLCGDVVGPRGVTASIIRVVTDDKDLPALQRFLTRVLVYQHQHGLVRLAYTCWGPRKVQNAPGLVQPDDKDGYVIGDGARRTIVKCILHGVLRFGEPELTAIFREVNRILVDSEVGAVDLIKAEAVEAGISVESMQNPVAQAKRLLQAAERARDVGNGFTTWVRIVESLDDLRETVVEANDEAEGRNLYNRAQQWVDQLPELLSPEYRKSNGKINFTKAARLIQDRIGWEAGVSEMAMMLKVRQALSVIDALRNGVRDPSAPATLTLDDTFKFENGSMTWAELCAKAGVETQAKAKRESTPRDVATPMFVEGFTPKALSEAKVAYGSGDGKNLTDLPTVLQTTPEDFVKNEKVYRGFIDRILTTKGLRDAAKAKAEAEAEAEKAKAEAEAEAKQNAPHTGKGATSTAKAGK